MTTATRKPAFTAYAVTGEGKQAFWTRIGSVWPHNYGEGFNIVLLGRQNGCAASGSRP